MRKSRFHESQRQAILDSHLKGQKTVDPLCEAHQISPATFYKWKNAVETEKNDGRRRLKELEVENLRPKQMYAELQRKHEVMSEAVGMLKKMPAHLKTDSTISTLAWYR